MPNWGGFLGALGNSFVGYGEDQKLHAQQARTQALDAQNAQLHGAQMANYTSEATQRNQRTAQDAALRTPAFEETYFRARQGDVAAQAKVASMVAGHPNASAILAPFVKTPPNDPIATHQANRDYDIEHPLPHVPTPAESLQATRERRLERGSAEGKVSGLRREMQGVLRNRPKSASYRNPLTFQPDIAEFNAALGNWRADSTETADALKRAQADLASVLLVTPAAHAPQKEAVLSDAHLWEKKKNEGLSPEQATAYVQSRKRPVGSP